MNTERPQAHTNEQRAVAKQDAVTNWNKLGPEMKLAAGAPVEDPPADTLSRAIFAAVKANPGSTAAQVAEYLTAQGREFKRGSLSPILTQMLRTGTIARSDGMYSAMQEQYKPLYHGKVVPKKARPKSKPRATVAKAPVKKTAKATAKPARAPAAKPKKKVVGLGFTITDEMLPLLVEAMTIKQARATYAILQTMFR